MRRVLALLMLVLLGCGYGISQVVWDYAARFGTGGYLAVPSTPVLEFNGSITLEGWVNPVNVDDPADQTLLCKYHAVGTGFDLTLRHGRIFMEIGGSTFRMLGKGTIPNGQWTHVAVVYDSSAHTLTTYLNGAVDSTVTGLHTPILSTTDSLIIGHFAPSPSVTQFTGLLDEVRIWNQALSAADIRTTMTMTLGYVSGIYSGLVFELPFQYYAWAPTTFTTSDWSGKGSSVYMKGVVTGERVGTGPSRKLVANDAVRINGTGYLVTPSSIDNNFGSSFTLQCHVWPDTIQTGTVLQKRAGSASHGYTIYLTGSRVAVRMNNSTWLLSRAPIPSQQWTHIAAVYNDTTKAIALYLNGVLDTTASPGGIQGPIPSTDSLYIGAGFNGGLRGYIDNVRISPAVWTLSQIREWMNAGLDTWNVPADLPEVTAYNFDGSLFGHVSTDLRMQFVGLARFSHSEYLADVPTSPMLRADDIGFPQQFVGKPSDRRIPETGTVGSSIDDSLNVTEDVTITGVRLAIALDHTWIGDVAVTVISPSGDSVRVFNHTSLRDPHSNLNAIFDDGADSAMVAGRWVSWLPRVRPANSLNATLAGKGSKGLWRLRMTDQAAGDFGHLYYWGLQFNNGGATGVPRTGDPLPGSPALFQNYPNPFNPSTSIRYQIASASNVRLAVYDVLGREVSVLVNERKAAGTYDVKFDGSRLSSGMYFYQLKAGDFVQTRKLLLLK